MKNMKRTNQKGFTLIELMIVIAIIGILASIALPAYQTYMKKAKFSEVVLATSNLKTAVELCYQDQGVLTNCTDKKNGITNVLTGATDITNGAKVKTVAVLAGKITATAVGTTGTAKNGLNGETYITKATENANKDALIWVVDPASTCKTASIC